MSNRYIDYFFSLRCAPDILATVGTVAQMSKEITETIGVVRQIRKIVVRNQRRYTLLDFCAGNALVPVTSVHLFKNVRAVAIDKRPRARNWEKAERFLYYERDIYSSLDFIPVPEEPVIITACHACGALSERVVDFYHQFGDYLVLLPCCRGKIADLPALFNSRLSQYDKWAYTLYMQAKAGSTKANMHEDPWIQSPKNIIITAEKAR
jgi:hypothetical protein